MEICLHHLVKLIAHPCELRLANPWKIARTEGSGSHRTVIVELTDADSWLRGQNPLLFDAQGKPKPAYEAVLKLPETLKK